MPYDPSVIPVGERIVRNVEAALQTIVPPAYATSNLKVRRWNGNTIHEASKHPTVVITEEVEDTHDRLLGRIDHLLPITLSIGLAAQQWVEPMRKLMADVRVALTNDHQRGGLARDTKILSAELLDSTPSSPLAAAQIHLVVHYQTLYHDPGTPI